MLIGLEASAAVVSARTGVGTYTASLIAALERLAAADAGRPDGQPPRFIYFSNRVAANGEPPDRNGATRIWSWRHDVYPRHQFQSRMFWMQVALPRSLAATRPDVCHFPNYLAPIVMGTRLPGGHRPLQDMPFLVTMHDMSVYRCPEHQPHKTVAVHRAMIPLVARRTQLIVAVSESARQDILHYLKVPPDRVRVVYEGIGEQFRSEGIASCGGSASPPGVTEVHAHHGQNFPYILTVGTLEPRKNHRRLIQAFTRLVQQERLPHHLVIAGTRGWKDGPLWLEARQSALADRIHFLGYVPAADLPGLYRGAGAFAFPSLYEGFGLPVLEALACGVPTLISTDAALTEVAGPGTTVVVEPTSAEDIAGGLHRLLTDSALTARLRERGFARAREFSWDRCAAETYRLYEEIKDELGSHDKPRPILDEYPGDHGGRTDTVQELLTSRHTHVVSPASLAARFATQAPPSGRLSR